MPLFRPLRLKVTQFLSAKEDNPSVKIVSSSFQHLGKIPVKGASSPTADRTTMHGKQMHCFVEGSRQLLNGPCSGGIEMALLLW